MRAARLRARNLISNQTRSWWKWKCSGHQSWVKPGLAQTVRSFHALGAKYHKDVTECVVHPPRGRTNPLSATDSTIYALSTAAGRAAIAIIRVSGPACIDVWTIYGFLCQYRQAPADSSRSTEPCVQVDHYHPHDMPLCALFTIPPAMNPHRLQLEMKSSTLML